MNEFPSLLKQMWEGVLTTDDYIDINIRALQEETTITDHDEVVQEEERQWEEVRCKEEVPDKSDLQETWEFDTNGQKRKLL